MYFSNIAFWWEYLQISITLQQLHACTRVPVNINMSRYFFICYGMIDAHLISPVPLDANADFDVPLVGVECVFKLAVVETELVSVIGAFVAK